MNKLFENIIWALVWSVTSCFSRAPCVNSSTAWIYGKSKKLCVRSPFSATASSFYFATSSTKHNLTCNIKIRTFWNEYTESVKRDTSFYKIHWAKNQLQHWFLVVVWEDVLKIIICKSELSCKMAKLAEYGTVAWAFIIKSWSFKRLAQFYKPLQSQNLGMNAELKI